MGDLISPNELMDLQQSEPVVVINVTMKNPVNGAQASADEGFIPNALCIDLDNQGSDHKGVFPHTLPDVNSFSALLGQLGISASTNIVFYDNQGIFCAPRLWWMMKSIGHKKVAVLDGGLPAWKQAGFTLQKEASHPQVMTEYKAEPQANWFLFLEDMKANLTSQSWLVLDARSAERFNARVDEPRPGVRRGHMPDAINVPFTELLNQGRFRSLDELAAIFTRKNIDLSKPITNSCGSGVTACIVAFALYLCGATQVSVYDGSWSEWGALDYLPVVTND
jgi:thiosulfate/3-mercaptopyruvate sulfurtransferase